MKMCALVIGHKKLSPGSENKSSGTTEFDYNDRLAQEIEKEVNGVSVQRVYRRTYSTLPGDINELSPDFIVSLHCNAYNEKVSGTEVLYYHKSATGRMIAEIMNTRLVDALGLKERGIKPKTAEDRGGYLLKETKAPCIIAEPFFLDNDDDFAVANRRHEQLVRAYADAIEEIAGKI